MKKRNAKMNASAISGNGLRGFLVLSLLLSIVSIKFVTYSNSPTIITDTLTIAKPTFLNES